ncbi:MAG: molybdenum cofactor biosynthesis protein MoaE [Burkholderiaceae bacterium]|nr:molybdenum cofactor biosynthesis protein MoaE [Burkholderiaceae bacterium]
MNHTRVSIQTGDFDLGAEVAALRAADARAGAVCAFVGAVREMASPTAAAATTAAGADAAAATASAAAPPGITALELEHYPGMSEKAIARMVAAARQRFDIGGVRIIHRVGALAPRDQIVLVAVAAAHRGAAFQACEFLMDYLKTQVPFWKKEHTANGQAHWVRARASDDAALARWGDGAAAGNAATRR